MARAIWGRVRLANGQGEACPGRAAQASLTSAAMLAGLAKYTP